MNFDFEQMMREGEAWQAKRDELFPKAFRDALSNLIYSCSGLAQVAQKGYAEYLFQRFDSALGISPTFQYLTAETNAEKIRHGNTTYAAYSFNENDVLKAPIRLDISNKVNDIPKHLTDIVKNGKRLVSRVDVEFYERTPLASDSKNRELREVIQDYLINGNWTRDELEDLGNLMALEDLEKIHAEFLVFEDDSMVVGYLGIGNNQPYNISEKSAGYGKNRFYRYDLLRVGGSPYEQTSTVRPGKDMKLTSQERASKSVGQLGYTLWVGIPPTVVKSFVASTAPHFLMHSMNGAVAALVVDGTGTVYAGGNFTTAGGVVANALARWNGATWSALGAGTDGKVLALVVDGSGTVYAGGDFTTAGGVASNYIARWNGTGWSTLGTGTDNNVQALVTQGPYLYAGGGIHRRGRRQQVDEPLRPLHPRADGDARARRRSPGPAAAALALPAAFVGTGPARATLLNALGQVVGTALLPVQAG